MVTIKILIKLVNWFEMLCVQYPICIEQPTVVISGSGRPKLESGHYQISLLLENRVLQFVKLLIF